MCPRFGFPIFEGLIDNLLIKRLRDRPAVAFLAAPLCSQEIPRLSEQEGSRAAARLRVHHPLRIQEMKPGLASFDRSGQINHDS
jgi:hypothetical protein